MLIIIYYIIQRYHVHCTRVVLHNYAWVEGGKRNEYDEIDRLNMIYRINRAQVPIHF